MPSFTKVAGASVTPSSFVKIVGQTDGKAVLCGAGDQIYGISQPGQRYPPWGALQDGNCAIVGESFMIYGPPEKDVLLRIAGTVAVGDRLKSDGSGFGIPVTSDADQFGAVAMVAGVSGNLILVQCVPPTQRA